MSISVEQVEQIARLAKLEFSDDEKLEMADQLAKIVEYVEKLNEINTDNIQPTYHVVDINNVFREDKTADSLSQEEVLKNAPKSKLGYFSVPKVIDK